MFGIFNMLQSGNNNIAKNKKENNDEPCYGGFSRRFDYEQCHKCRVTPAVVMIAFVVSIVCGIIGFALAIVIYDFVQAHKPLYYPSQSIADQTLQQESSDNTDYVTGETEAFVVVTEEQSMIYRIPIGIMVTDSPENNTKIPKVLKNGDIIVEVNDLEITSIDELPNFEQALNSEKATTMRVFRNNNYIDVTVSNSK